MKYIVKNKNYEYVSDNELLDLLLKQRGVDNPQLLLNLTPEVLFGELEQPKMLEAITLLHKHVQNNSRMHLIVDSDADGYTASATLYQYLLDLGIQATYDIHSGKEHGIKEEVLNNYDFDLLLVPDAGSSDFEWHEKLVAMGKDVIIIDHHEYDYEYDTKAIIVNNQHPQAPNPTLSGVGMVYKLCRAYDKAYGYSFANYYLDLVATGMIGDAMDMRNPETRFLTLQGLEMFGQQNEFLKLLFEKQAYSMNNKATITSVGWFIAPIINGVIRSGSYDEKMDLFKALIGVQEEIEYKPRKSKNNPNPTLEIQSLQQAMIRISLGIKAKQDREVKKGMELVEQRIEEQGLEEDKIIIVDISDILSQTFTGLVANKLATKYKRPCILLREKQTDTNFYGGSGRNYSKFALDDLRGFLLSTQMFDEVQGHTSAFGFALNKNNVKALINMVNEQLKDTKIEDVYHVDFSIPCARLKEKHIMQIGKYADLWGNSIPEPTFLIDSIYIDSSEVKLLGEKKNFVKFDVERGGQKISFVKKFTNEDFYNKLVHHNPRGLTRLTNKRLEISVIGKFTINQWESGDKVHEVGQVEIIDIESKVMNNKVMF